MDTEKTVEIASNSFDDFLHEEEIYDEVTAAAIKRVIAWKVTQSMNDCGLTKTDMANRMGTSRASLNRLLDPGCTALTLATLIRAANVLGQDVNIDFTPRKGRSNEPCTT